MVSRFIVVISLLSVFFCVSCTSTKKIAYFGDTRDSEARAVLGNVEAPFQKNDILNVTISSLSPKDDLEYNRTDITSRGYLVDNDGNIQMPKLGNIKAEGLTKKQLITNITKAVEARKELLNPIVEIRHLNFEVTVLGEVSHPTVITVPSEQISLVKALGLAGDLTIYGKRDNVLLIREEDGKRMTRHLNLNSAEFLSSPYYYLKANDVIYVEPSKSKIATTDRAQQIIPIVVTGISILVLVIDRVIK